MRELYILRVMPKQAVVKTPLELELEKVNLGVVMGPERNVEG